MQTKDINVAGWALRSYLKDQVTVDRILGLAYMVPGFTFGERTKEGSTVSVSFEDDTWTIMEDVLAAGQADLNPASG
jgi:hypothetical protein